MIKIVGDINFTDGFFDTGFGVGSRINSGNDPFQYLSRNTDDFWIGNFECVCSNISNKRGIYAKQFIINPSLLSSIVHLDIYGVANNHVMQHGGDAYQVLLQSIKDNGAQYVGSDIDRSIIFDYQTKKIGILAFNQRPENFSSTPLYWSMPEYKEIEFELAKLSDCDFRIAYVHWGNEFINYPYIDQKQLAHWMVDSGVDLIVGMHPHVLQGYEIYKGKYIFYSLGNFVFNMPWSNTRYSAIINLDVQNNFSVSYDYVHINNDYFPRIVNESEVPSINRFDYLNSLLDKQNENEVYYRKVFKYIAQYRRANYLYMVKNMYRFRLKDVLAIMIDYIKRKF